MSAAGVLYLPSISAVGVCAPGRGAISIPSLTVSGNASALITRAGAIVFPVITIQGEGVHGAYGGIVLPGFQIAATFGARGTADIAPLGISGTAHLSIAGRAGILIPRIIIRGVAVSGQSGVGALVLPGLYTAGSMHESPIGRGALVLPVVSFSGTAYNTIIYQTVVVQAKHFAVSEYKNFNFDYFCEYPKGVFLAADASGNLYQLYSASGLDNGSLIEAELQFGTTDLGADTNKNCVDGFINFRGDGDVEIRALVDEKVDPNSGEEAPDIYHIVGAPDGRLKTYKFKMSRYRTGRNWRFSVKNVNGSSLDINEVAVFYDILSRRGNGH